MADGNPRVVILPKQVMRLLEESYNTGAAIGITQDGNTLHLDTGRRKLHIDANGNEIPKEN